MGAEAEVVCRNTVTVLDVKLFGSKASTTGEIDRVVTIPSPVLSPTFGLVRVGDSVSADLSTSPVSLSGLYFGSSIVLT